MTVTSITRSLKPADLKSAFLDLDADIALDLPVQPNRFANLIASDPLEAGADFAQLTLRMADYGALSEKEKAYLPWLSVARRALVELGVRRMDIEAKLGRKSGPLHGVCDLLMSGGPKRVGVAELKLIRYGELSDVLPERALLQLGSYVSLADRRGDGRAVWAVLVFVEIKHRMVKLRGFRSAEGLLSRTLPLLPLAA